MPAKGDKQIWVRKHFKNLVKALSAIEGKSIKEYTEELIEQAYHKKIKKNKKYFLE